MTTPVLLGWPEYEWSRADGPPGKSECQDCPYGLTCKGTTGGLLPSTCLRPCSFLLLQCPEAGLPGLLLHFRQPDLSPSHPVPTAGRSPGPSAFRSSSTERLGQPAWPVEPALLGRSRDTLALGLGGSREGFGQGDVQWHPEPAEMEGEESSWVTNREEALTLSRQGALTVVIAYASYAAVPWHWAITQTQEYVQ